MEENVSGCFFSEHNVHNYRRVFGVAKNHAFSSWQYGSCLLWCKHYGCYEHSIGPLSFLLAVADCIAHGSVAGYKTAVTNGLWLILNLFSLCTCCGVINENAIEVWMKMIILWSWW